MALTKISTDGVKDDAITKTKIPANQIEASELADNAVDTNAIADQAVALSKLPHGTSSNNGKFLRANNGADPTFETVSTDLVADTTPQLGGDLASNGHDIKLADTDKITAGTGDDLLIYHDGSHSYIYDTGVGKLRLVTNSFRLLETDNTASMIAADENGAVQLYYDGTLKFETGTNYSVVSSISNGNPAGLKIRNVDSNSNYSHAEVRLESKNGLSYGAIFNDHANGCVRIGHNTTGNTLEIFNDGVIRSQGIKFGSDTSSANDLHDYEEGDWQPKLNGNNMSHGHADYVKIGQFVHVDFDITNDTGGFATGITGLPFTAAEYSAFTLGWVSSTTGGSLASSNLQGGLIHTDTLNFRDAGGNTDTNLLNGQRIIGHATYRTTA